MKIKPNPLRGTVTNWISGRPKVRKSKITLLAFFNDLENRGPFSPNSVFRQWTSSIRLDMIEAGTWLKRSKPSLKAKLVFVQEYISRLQVKFWTMNEYHQNEYQCVIDHEYDILLPYWYDDLDFNGIKTFKMIYKMIRVFGLRMKLFCLLKPRLYRGMKYRHLLIESIVTEYFFGKMHIEKGWPYYWARRYFERRKKPFRSKMYLCAPLKLPIGFS